jgi:hypothetical protein
MRNHCEVCGDRLEMTEDSYLLHIRRFHPIKQVSVRLPGYAIKPLRTTTRTKKEIVHDMEKIWGSAITPSVKPWHTLEVK